MTAVRMLEAVALYFVRAKLARGGIEGNDAVAALLRERFATARPVEQSERTEQGLRLAA